jgi:hypothetical protein
VYAAWCAGNLTPAQVDWIAGWDACRAALVAPVDEPAWKAQARALVRSNQALLDAMDPQRPDEPVDVPSPSDAHLAQARGQAPADQTPSGDEAGE